MDSTWIFFFSLFFTILPFLLLLLLHLKTNGNGGGRGRGRGRGRRKYPPSPPFPIVLNLIRLIFTEPMVKIGQPLRRLQSLSPIVSFRLGPIPFVFILDRRLAHELLVQKGASFTDRPPFPPNGFTDVISSNFHIIISGCGSTWRLLRRNLTSEILHPSRMKTFSDGRKWVMDGLIREIREKAGEGDGVVEMEVLRRWMFRLVTFMCFGLKMDDGIVAEIQKVHHDLILMFFQLTVFDIAPVPAKILLRRRWRRFLAIRRRQEELLLPLVESRREAINNGGNTSVPVSYLDSLLVLTIPEEDDRNLRNNEIVSLCSEFLIAGTESPNTTLEWAMANLVNNQITQRRLLSDINKVVKHQNSEIREDDLNKIPYLKAVIFETLRRHPPGHLLLPHIAKEEVTLESYLIPKGAVVNFLLPMMGWDDEVWDDPFEFTPERFLVAGEFDEEKVDLTGSREIKMVPFGAGRRICPGVGLSMLHLECFLANLVREFDWKPEVEDEVVDLSPKAEFSVSMKNSLRARVKPRKV